MRTYATATPLFALVLLGLFPALGDEDTDVIQHPARDVTVIRQDGRRDLVVNGRTFTEVPSRGEEMIAPNQEESDRGYIIYSRRASDGVRRSSRPKREEVATELSIAVTPGESRHARFTVFALRDLGKVAVSASDLAASGRARISKAQVVVRPVRLRYVRNYWDPKYYETPRILDRPGVPTTIDRETNQTYWITVRAPAKAAAGRYRGSIAIAPANGKRTELELVVDVLPFRLDDAMWWGMYEYTANPGNANIERDFADMKAHGVNSLLYCPHPPNGLPPMELKDGKIKVDFTHADKVFALIKKHGFRGPIAYYPRLTSCRVLDLLGLADRFKVGSYYGARSIIYDAKDYPEEARKALADVFRQMIDHAKKAGWPEILWYPVDEPNEVNDPEYNWAMVEYPTIKMVDPKAKTFCTIYNGDVLKALDPWVDVTAGDLWGLMGASGAVEAAHKRGDKLFGIRWICQHDEYWWARCIAGIVPERLGLDGFTEWTYYGATPLTADPYADLRGEKDVAYSYVSPEDGSLLPTVVWEAVQEGIDDSRYVRTLRRHIGAAKKSKNPRLRDIAASAESRLQEILGPYNREVGWWTEERLDEARRAMANEILKLMGTYIPD